MYGFKTGMMRRALIAASIMSLVGLAACSDDPNEDNNGGGGGGIIGGAAGRIEALPATINFDATPINGVSTKTVILENTGEGVLRLSSIKLEENDEDDRNEFEPSGAWPSDARLDPGESIALEVKWSPKNTTRDTGTIRIATNDSLARNFEVPITTPALEPDISSPRLVQFPRVPTGETQRLLTSITNSGQAPLQLKRIILSPVDATEFSVTFPVAGQESDPTADTTSWADVIAPGDKIDVRVGFTPTSTNPASAEIIIDSNDPDSPQYRVNLSGNAGVPIIELGGVDVPDPPTADESHVLNFGPSSIGRQNTRTVRIRNAGTERLDVDDISVVDDGGGVFELVQTSLPGGLPEESLELEPDEEAIFAVAYTPSAEITNQGRLVLNSNDPVSNQLRVDIIGVGSTNACPIAVGEASIVDGSANATTQISTIPLKTIQFDGSRSTDPGGSVQRYEWEIVQKPINSNARLTPNNEDVKPRMFLDLAGDYVVELTVFDDLNVPSCDTAQIFIRAQPDEDIHVQLVWETPADRDQSDIIGTDIDLHYLHPLGSWDKLPYDIYWNNKEADWAVPGRADDNPSLDIDDTDGAGPENVNHDNPESGNNYAVGVYYYSDNGFGASYATVRIYIEGLLKYEKRDKYLERENVFWSVAAVVWPLQAVIEVDSLQIGRAHV